MTAQVYSMKVCNRVINLVTVILIQHIRFRQGHTKPLKAARGHVTHIYVTCRAKFKHGRSFLSLGLLYMAMVP